MAVFRIDTVHASWRPYYRYALFALRLSNGNTVNVNQLECEGMVHPKPGDHLLINEDGLKLAVHSDWQRWDLVGKNVPVSDCEAGLHQNWPRARL